MGIAAAAWMVLKSHRRDIQGVEVFITSGGLRY